MSEPGTKKPDALQADQQSSKPSAPNTGKSSSGKALHSFGIFFIFFVFYMGTAILQTPSFKSIASIPIFGMPCGLFLSLMVFPVSWLLIFIYFRTGR